MALRGSKKVHPNQGILFDHHARVAEELNVAAGAAKPPQKTKPINKSLERFESVIRQYIRNHWREFRQRIPEKLTEKTEGQIAFALAAWTLREEFSGKIKNAHELMQHVFLLYKKSGAKWRNPKSAEEWVDRVKRAVAYSLAKRVLGMTARIKAKDPAVYDAMSELGAHELYLGQYSNNFVKYPEKIGESEPDTIIVRALIAQKEASGYLSGL